MIGYLLMPHLKFNLPVLAASFCFVSLGAAQSADGIQNLLDADVELLTNHDPDSELANFELLPGYEVNLFASEPMLANPIHMTWDSRGRLWVACSWSYPQVEPGGVANDKIIILEDTDGDGRADKSTVFADGLYIPTGLELTNGGCVVGQSPDVFFLKDTDGDDVADVKELLLTGFGIEDSHHSISAWRRGPDGKIYFQEGIFLHSQVETQHGVVRNFNGGVYQYNPRTRKLQMFARGTGGNPWGLVFDRWGQPFMANNPRILYLEPGTGAMTQKPPIGPLIVTDKQCGGDLISGTHLPEEMQGQFLTGRFKSRMVARYEFIDDGAGFSANVLPPLIKSKHPNFRPVDVKIGPDGAVYVADWYNSIINHAQHDFRDPRRDHQHGRIWRITHKDRPLVEKPELVGRSVPELVDQLGSLETWNRHQARKELSEREPDQVLAAVEAWVATLDPMREDYDHCLVEAMWACQNVERVSESILERVLSAEDGNARSAGTRVIRDWHDSLSDPVGTITRMANDPFPRVRMEAVLSGSHVARAEVVPAMMHVLDHDQDRFINAVIPPALAALRPHWGPRLEKDELAFANPAHREFVELLAGISLDKRVRALFTNPGPPQNELKQIKAMLVKSPSVELVQIMVDGVAQNRVQSDLVTLMLLEVLGDIGQKGSFEAPRQMTALSENLADENDAIAVAIADTLGAWKLQQTGRDLIAVMRDMGRAPAVRQAAAVALAKLGRTEFVNELLTMAKTGDIAGRYHAAAALIWADLEYAKDVLAALLTTDPGPADPVSLVQGFTRIRLGDSQLAAALEGIRIHPRVVSTVAEWHRQTGQLSSRLTGFFEQPSSGSLSVDLLSENQELLVADVEKLGDPARGELIYRRPALACTSCHGIGPVGPETGPNLVSVGAAAGASYMVESILSPNAAIAEHYENMMFTLRDNSTRVGVVTYESAEEIVYRDSAQGGKEVTLQVSEIERKTVMPTLMPSGLADQLENRQEFLDLAIFLARLGRPGAYANDESPIVRKWKVVPFVGPAIPDSNESWRTVYSLVGGALPASDLGDAGMIAAQGEVEVLVGGGVQLEINDLTGLKLWVDDQEIPDLSAVINLGTGRHAFTFLIDRGQRGETGLRVEFVAAKGSAVKLKAVGGT